MKKTTPQIYHIFSSEDSNLRQIIAKTQALKVLDAKLKELLTEIQPTAFTVANFRGDTLVIQVNSSALLTQLRFQTAEILQRLKRSSEYQHLQKVEFFIGA